MNHIDDRFAMFEVDIYEPAFTKYGKFEQEHRIFRRFKAVD